MFKKGHQKDYTLSRKSDSGSNNFEVRAGGKTVSEVTVVLTSTATAYFHDAPSPAKGRSKPHPPRAAAKAS